MKLVAFDLETTGLSAQRDRIVEIGAVRFEASGVEIDCFEALVNPGCPISPAAQAVHGIRREDLIAAPSADDALGRFFHWLGPAEQVLLLAHNAGFDTGFLARELARAGIATPAHVVVDTLSLARRLIDSPSYRLDRLAQSLGLDCGPTHRALSDSQTVMRLWMVLSKAPGFDVNSLAQSFPGAVFRIVDPSTSPHPMLPAGCDWLSSAIDLGLRVRIEYFGGTKGATPREITPRRVENRGGRAYVVALCHVDTFEKEFRLDRIGAGRVAERS